MTSNNKVHDSLIKILYQERRTGYVDSVVIGGLDAFIEKNLTKLTNVLPKGFARYSELNVNERRKLAELIDSNIKENEKSNLSGKLVESQLFDRYGNQVGFRAGKSIQLGSSIKVLKGNLPKRTLLKLEENMGIRTVGDLLFHFPNRHDDFSEICKINQLKPGLTQSVVAVVWETVAKTGFRGKKRVDLILSDETGNLKISLFNQVWAARELSQGTRVMISGRVSAINGIITIDSPVYEVLTAGSTNIHTGRLVPVYPLTSGISQRFMRRLVNSALSSCVSSLEEFLPANLVERIGLLGFREAVSKYHYPQSEKELSNAKRRLAFDELFLMQMVARKRKLEWENDVPSVSVNRSEKVARFISTLPFTLTKSQQNSVEEILSDMCSTSAMRRLLQGDVGSGKTVVAACAMLAVTLGGNQAALMAPTEVLAEQHFSTLVRLLNKNNSSNGAATLFVEPNIVEIQVDRDLPKLTMALLMGSLTESVKRKTRQRLSRVGIDIVVGTHALLQDSVDIPRLTLAVIDEQQRFGVLQRDVLQERLPRPHMLVMSATPIPRSLALTMCGDLDISTIDELPVGRKPIRTIVESSDRRKHVYDFIREEVKDGKQAFIVFPLVDESESVNARAAVEEHLRLSTSVFTEMKVGLIHGRMKLDEKEYAMELFRNGDTQILVATSVVEVGVDVPNASVMLIEGADRFGLSQMHQFRGRVGRGEHQSHCVLIADDPNEIALKRMEIMKRVGDGFRLAEEDLNIRGPGDYIGTRQSGQPIFKVATISDSDILSLASVEAKRLMEVDPFLSADENSNLKKRYDEAQTDLRVS